jgi:hypothetical protein
MSDFLSVSLVPDISNKELEEMLDIVKPILLREGKCWELKLNGVSWRQTAFNWSPKLGREVRVSYNNGACAICPTFHRSAVFFKPSIAEFYACIRLYVPEWRKCKYALLDEETKPVLWNNIETVYSSRALLFNIEFGADGKPLE